MDDYAFCTMTMQGVFGWVGLGFELYTACYDGHGAIWYQGLHTSLSFSSSSLLVQWKERLYK